MNNGSSGKKALVLLLLASGAGVVIYRLFAGLGAVSALSDSQPWGLVKSLNILTCASLAAGASVVAACVHVFGLKDFRPALRPALLLGLLLHTSALAALLYDVGSPIDVWRIVLHPNLHSVMFLAFLCEAFYTSALIAEAAPELAGPDRLAGARRALDAARGPLAVLSAVAAVVYQSTLGALYLVSPHRVSQLWYSPWLPVLFLLSAAAAGLAMTSVQACAGGSPGRRQLDAPLMSKLGSAMSAVLVLYVALRLADLAARGTASAEGFGTFRAVWLLVEITAGFALPAAMLASGRIRRTSAGILAASALVVLGVAMNRAGVVMVGWDNPSGHGYFPSAIEMFASFFFMAAPLALYPYASRSLNPRSEAR